MRLAMRLTKTHHGLLLLIKKLHRPSYKLRLVIHPTEEFHIVIPGDICILAHRQALHFRVELVPVATAAAVVKLFTLLGHWVVEVLGESET